MAGAALTAVGLSLGCLGLGGAALAASTHGPNLEVSVIQATVSDASLSIDPRLQDLATQLTTQQPFVRYRAFTLVSRTQFPLQPEGGKTITYVLPTGQVLHASLDGTVVENGEKRYKLTSQIASPVDAGAPVNVQVTASASTPFFVGVQSNKTSATFVELKVYP
jgi:hypothetical protein